MCVGDTLDRKKTFPKNKSDLLSKTDGQKMFDIARGGLVDMAAFVKSYRGTATKPAKFCKGFGLFQYDLQFFLKEPGYFLDKTWATLPGTLGKALQELRAALETLGLQHKHMNTCTERSVCAWMCRCVCVGWFVGGWGEIVIK